MSPARSNDRPSLQDHLTAPSGTESTLAAARACAFLLRGMMRLAGAGRLAVFFAVVAVPWANALGADTSIVADNAPMAVAIRSFFMESEPFDYQLTRAGNRNRRPV